MAVFLVTGTDLIVALLCPFIVVSTALNRGLLRRACCREASPIFSASMSFSIYLIHEPCRRLAALFFTSLHPRSVGTGHRAHVRADWVIGGHSAGMAHLYRG